MDIMNTLTMPWLLMLMQPLTLLKSFDPNFLLLLLLILFLLILLILLLLLILLSLRFLALPFLCCDGLLPSQASLVPSLTQMARVEINSKVGSRVYWLGREEAGSDRATV